MTEDETKVEAEKDTAEKETEEEEKGKAAQGTEREPTLVSCDKQRGLSCVFLC